jgi:hypothetical protein
MMMVERASTNRGSRKFNEKVHVLAEPGGASARHICTALRHHSPLAD